jgi:hypothetical protein
MQKGFYSWHGYFCKIPPDLTLGVFKTQSVSYFWVKPILGDHVLLFLATVHRINFSEIVGFSGRFISDSVVFSTIKCIEYSLLIRKLQIQF